MSDDAGRRSAVVILNPASASGRTGQRWPELRRALIEAGLAVSLRATTSRGEATALTREALVDGCQLVVAAGGDGTINEVANGFFDNVGGTVNANAELAVLPSGSGGDLRRSLGVPTDPPAAARAIVEGPTMECDVGRIDYADGSPPRHFLNIADCGVGGEVVARVNGSSRRLGGPLTFLYHSLAGVLSFAPRMVEIAVDGRAMERTVQNVVIANGRYFGGGMKVAPLARLDDGRFDIVLILAASRRRTLRALPRLYRGTHLNHPGVEMLRGSTVTVTPLGGEAPMLFDVDGEQVGGTSATLTCLPGALRMRVPGSLH